MSTSRPAVYELLASLDDVRDPGCSRKLRVSAGATLARLTRVLASAFDWPSDAPYVFVADDLRLEGQWRRGGEEGETSDVRLRQLLPGPGAVLAWEYGPRWTATVVLVAVHNHGERISTPVCVGATGFSPRFDGDPWGFEPLPWSEADVVRAVNASLASLRGRVSG